jgi:hypothetical protein
MMRPLLRGEHDAPDAARPQHEVRQTGAKKVAEHDHAASIGGKDGAISGVGVEEAAVGEAKLPVLDRRPHAEARISRAAVKTFDPAESEAIVQQRLILIQLEGVTGRILRGSSSNMNTKFTELELLV